MSVLITMDHLNDTSSIDTEEAALTETMQRLSIQMKKHLFTMGNDIIYTEDENDKRCQFHHSLLASIKSLTDDVEVFKVKNALKTLDYQRLEQLEYEIELQDDADLSYDDIQNEIELEDSEITSYDMEYDTGTEDELVQSGDESEMSNESY